MNQEQHREVFRPDEQCASCKSWVKIFTWAEGKSMYLNLEKCGCSHPKHSIHGEHPCEDWEQNKDLGEGISGKDLEEKEGG